MIPHLDTHLVYNAYLVKSIDFLLAFNVVFIISKDLKPVQNNEQ